MSLSLKSTALRNHTGFWILVMSKELREEKKKKKDHTVPWGPRLNSFFLI